MNSITEPKLEDNVTESPKNDDRQYIKLGNSELLLLKQALGIKNTKCYYCKKKIEKGDMFAIFNYPTRLLCNSIMCLSEAMEEDDEE